MAKRRKSVTGIRLTEVGRCIRKLYEAGREHPKGSALWCGINLSITILGQYKHEVRETRNLENARAAAELNQEEAANKLIVAREGSL